MEEKQGETTFKNSLGKAGIVTIIGRPSAGKSTFLNTASGEKISIVSPVPQTTRNALRGIVNTSFGQLVFVDTPGYHDSEKKLNKKLKEVTQEQLVTSDALLYILDATRIPGPEEILTAALVKPHIDKTIIALNKIDLPTANVSEGINFLKQVFPEISENRIFQISAEKDTNINDVLKALYQIIPQGEPLYPEEFYTDQEVDFRIAEIIREQAINRLYDEIPHAIYVDISDMEWRREGKELWVRAFLCVERESQKGMVIGKGASMIKTIRIESIKQLRKIFSYRIDLDLQVKVNKNWRQKDVVLNRVLK
ncbi:MAG: GTPase Era [Spirochaetaceae bacterium]|nr:GTPase Era [Spirochaetaceae bacterium]